MADTTFVDGSTLTAADWFNDVNRLLYTILSDPADIAAIRTALTATMTWTTPTFAAGDFTSDVGSWTVAAGDVQTFAYTIMNKVMIVSFNILNSTVATTPNLLKILIPASKTSTKAMRTCCQILDNGTQAAAVAYVEAGSTFINIQRLNAANFANATDNTYVLGQIFFEIN